MEIKIRQKPQRSTGKTSLVLEYYYGYTRDDEGRIKHRRKFETLEYYLYTDPKTSWSATTTRSISKWPRRSSQTAARRAERAIRLCGEI